MNEEGAKEVRDEVTLPIKSEEQKEPKPSGLGRINTLTAASTSILEVATAMLKASATLVIVMFLVFNFDLIKDLFVNVSHVEAFGVKMDFDATAKQIIKETPDGVSGPNVHLVEAEGALKRAAKSSEVYVAASILWIDDHPEDNVAIRRVFQDLGANVTVTLDTAEAADALRRGFFDVVISDIVRPEGNDVAIAFTKKVAEIPDAPAFIFYVGQLDSRNPPNGAFAITNRPDELLNLVTDVLERRFHTR